MQPPSIMLAYDASLLIRCVSHWQTFQPSLLYTIKAWNLLHCLCSTRQAWTEAKSKNPDESIANKNTKRSVLYLPWLPWAKQHKENLFVSCHLTFPRQTKFIEIYVTVMFLLLAILKKGCQCKRAFSHKYQIKLIYQSRL